MSELTRKDFLRLTSWGLVAALLPFEKINAIASASSSKKSLSLNDFEQAQLLAKQAKEKFHLKDFSLAEQLYLQAIELAPAYIQFYDGLSKVFCNQNFYLQNVELYKNALLNNDTKVVFYDRAARSLMSLETGNKKATLQYKNAISSTSLLNDALLLYQTAISIDSTKEFLTIGHSKILDRINILPLEANFRTNKIYKNRKHQNKNALKLALQGKTDDEIRAFIQKMDDKQRRELITLGEIKQRERSLIIQKKKFYNFIESKNDLTEELRLDTLENLFKVDYKDPRSLKKIKVIYYNNNRFFDFIEVRRKFAEASKTFYGHIGLIDAIEKAYIKGQASVEILNQAIQIGNDLKEWSLEFRKEVELAIKMCKIMLYQADYNSAKEYLQEIMSRTKTDSKSISNKLIHYYAKIHFAEANYNLAKNILLIGLKQLDEETLNNLTQDYPNLELVNKVAKNKVKDNFKENIILNYLLFSTYVALNESEKATEIFDKLKENNPQDSFVTTKM